METIVKPITTASDPKPVKDATPGVESSEDKLANPSPLPEPDKKDPNTLETDLKERRLRDGSLIEWEWQGPLQDEPLFHATREALGFGNGQMDQNLIADIGKIALTLLQDTNPERLTKFLTSELMHTPQIGNPLYNLRRNLEYLLEKEKGGNKYRYGK